MLRGLGNPLRNVRPTPQMYSEELGRKFKAWRTQFSLENGLNTVAQLPALKARQFEAWLDMEIKLTNDGDRRKALVNLKVAREASKVDGNIDSDFYKRFLTWLMGKGANVDHLRTPWGRRAVALELPDVRELLEAFLDEIAFVENKLFKLVFRGPQTLNDYFLYFKYVLQNAEFVLVEDPWLFLDFRLYAGGSPTRPTNPFAPDFDGKYHLGEDGRPRLDKDLDTRLDANLSPQSRQTFAVIQDFFEMFAKGSAQMKEVSEDLQEALDGVIKRHVALTQFEKLADYEKAVEAHEKELPPEIQIVDQQKEMIDLLREIAGRPPKAKEPPKREPEVSSEVEEEFSSQSTRSSATFEPAEPRTTSEQASASPASSEEGSETDPVEWEKFGGEEVGGEEVVIEEGEVPMDPKMRAALTESPVQETPEMRATRLKVQQETSTGGGRFGVMPFPVDMPAFREELQGDRAWPLWLNYIAERERFHTPEETAYMMQAAGLMVRGKIQEAEAKWKQGHIQYISRKLAEKQAKKLGHKRE